MIDSVIKANKKYYLQPLLEEFKCIQEKMKTENYINEELEKSESESELDSKTESDIDNEEQLLKIVHTLSYSLFLDFFWLLDIFSDILLISAYVLLDIFSDILFGILLFFASFLQVY